QRLAGAVTGQEGDVLSRRNGAPQQVADDSPGGLPVAEQLVRDDDMRRNLMGLQGDLDQLGVGFGLLRALADPLPSRHAADALVRDEPRRPSAYRGVLRRTLPLSGAPRPRPRSAAACAGARPPLGLPAAPGMARRDGCAQRRQRVESPGALPPAGRTRTPGLE